MNLRFCDKAHPGDLLGVIEKSFGLKIRERGCLGSGVLQIVSPQSVGVVVSEKSRKTRSTTYNWYRVVFKDYSEGNVVIGWVCANTSGLTMTVLEKGIER